jgi:two-component system nitrogen regulation response regulator NtrX
MTAARLSLPFADAVRTLIVDDDPFVRESLREILEHEGYVALEAGDGKTALELLDHDRVDLLLLDLELPRVSGIQVLRELADRRLDIPVVIISGKGSIPTAVATTKLGAFDFIEKPLHAERTLAAIRSALHQRATLRQRSRTLEEAFATYGMWGATPAMQQIYQSIDRAAATRAKVLLVGESGTGKELIARAIHRLGPRVDRPFVAVNCAAVPETLIESELFGHAEGAFTGARRTRRGSFEQASGGTLFLDEIGDMSLMTQAKVLRAIETGEFRRVGAEMTSQADFRLIAASNKDLMRELADGNFREDLYYRIGVITIRVPALRDRREDIPPLVQHLLVLHSERNESPPASLTPAALAVLTHHDWPGNVRELSNTIERLTVMHPAGALDAGVVRAALRREPPAAADDGSRSNLREARSQFDRDFIVASLIAHGWRIQETAEALGINRSHLWKKMRRLRIEPPVPG